MVESGRSPVDKGRVQSARSLVTMALALVTLLWAIAASVAFFWILVAGLALSGNADQQADTWEWRSALILGVLPLVSAVALFLCVMFHRRGIAAAAVAAGLASTLILTRMLLDGQFDRVGTEARLFLLIGVATSLATTITMPRQSHAAT